MKSFKNAVLYGLLVWLIPLGAGMIMFQLRTDNRILFESLIPIAVVLATTIFSVIYFKKVSQNFLKEGISLGIIFLLISIIIDLAVYSRGPMQMPIGEYFEDIGVTYIIIPIITISLGYILEKKAKQNNEIEK